MKIQHNDDFKPRSRLISVVGNTTIFGILLTIFCLWHNSEMDVLKLSYENRILAIQSEIKGLELSGRINVEGSKRMTNILQELVDSRRKLPLPETIVVVITGVSIFLFFNILIASYVVMRNRTVVKSAYKKGLQDGEKKGKGNLDLSEAEEAEEFILNYVQKGGE